VSKKSTEEAVPTIWLNEQEDIGVADCGCRLIRDHKDTGDPAFVFCPLHDCAAKLLKKLEVMVTVFNFKKIDAITAFVAIEHARHVIALAKGKPT
jgi:hypothetical protein